MAGTAIARWLTASPASSTTLLRRLFPPFQTQIPNSPPVPSTVSFIIRPFSHTPTPPKRNTLVSFSLSDSEDSDEEVPKSSAKQIDKSKLPPPYDPFNKNTVNLDPKDPKNLQEVFAGMWSDGLINNAVKMFDGLSKQGLTHEALELFSQIKDKGEMPEVVAHTAVIEAYAAAGQPREAHRSYLRMLASGVHPNAYTYGVVIESLVGSGEVKMLREAGKCVVEMVEKRGMKLNAEICVGVFEGMVNAGLEDEGKELLEIVKNKGVVPEESKMREVLRNKRGTVYRALMQIFYGK